MDPTLGLITRVWILFTAEIGKAARLYLWTIKLAQDYDRAKDTLEQSFEALAAAVAELALLESEGTATSTPSS